MTNSNDKKIVCWFEKTETINVDPLGRMVIEDKDVLEAIAGGVSECEMDLDDELLDNTCGAGCRN